MLYLANKWLYINEKEDSSLKSSFCAFVTRLGSIFALDVAFNIAT